MVEHIYAGWVDDKDPQTFPSCGCVADELIYVMVAEAVADYYEPRVFDRYETLEFQSVPRQQHAAVYAGELIAAHDQKSVVSLCTMPKTARSMQLKVRLKVAGELEVCWVIGDAQVKEITLIRV